MFLLKYLLCVVILSLRRFDYTYDLVSPRLKKILLAAKNNQVFLNIDAEHYDYRDLGFKIYQKVLLSTDELKNFQQTGIVLQAYLEIAMSIFAIF